MTAVAKCARDGEVRPEERLTRERVRPATDNDTGSQHRRDGDRPPRCLTPSGEHLTGENVGLAREVGPSDVTVNALAPGAFESFEADAEYNQWVLDRQSIKRRGWERTWGTQSSSSRATRRRSSPARPSS
jgi:hypothetical protein